MKNRRKGEGNGAKVTLHCSQSKTKSVRGEIVEYSNNNDRQNGRDVDEYLKIKEIKSTEVN